MEATLTRLSRRKTNMAKDKRVFLKIKLKQLASEARDIRREERKQIRRTPVLDEHGEPKGRWRPLSAYPDEKGPMMNQGSPVLRLKSAVCEIKIGELLPALHSHRIHVVRREARDTQLAYAFVRGKAYSTVESGATTHPNWENVRRMILKYGSYEFQYDRAGEVLAWVNDAKDIINANATTLKRT